MSSTGRHRFWWVAFAVTFAMSASVLYLMYTATYDDPADAYRLEAAKLLLQFLLVGVGGALVLAFLNFRRDIAEAKAVMLATAEKEAADARAAAQEHAAARRAALQELVRELGDAHRRLKLIKRQLRATVARPDPDEQPAPVPPYHIPAPSFERSMEALLNAQIAAEEVRDRIGLTYGLLERHQIERICTALRYGARYFHDVYEDYEHCRVRREEQGFLVTPSCRNLHNFLFARQPPVDLGPEGVRELEAQFNIMREDRHSLEQRHQALRKIREMRRQDPRRRRFRTVATECFALAADELRHAMWNTGAASEPDCVGPAPAANPN